MPALTLLGTAGMCKLSWNSGRASSHPATVSGCGAAVRFFITSNPPPTTTWTEAMMALSIVTNILTTFLTAGRIWWARLICIKNWLQYLRMPVPRSCFYESHSMSFGPSQIRYKFLIHLIVDSGVLVTISKIIEVILYVLQPKAGSGRMNALYIVMYCVPQITVSLIILLKSPC